MSGFSRFIFSIVCLLSFSLLFRLPIVLLRFFISVLSVSITSSSLFLLSDVFSICFLRSLISSLSFWIESLSFFFSSSLEEISCFRTIISFFRSVTISLPFVYWKDFYLNGLKSWFIETVMVLLFTLIVLLMIKTIIFIGTTLKS